MMMTIMMMMMVMISKSVAKGLTNLSQVNQQAFGDEF